MTSQDTVGSEIWKEALNHASQQLSTKDLDKLKSITSYDDFSKDLESRVKLYRDSSKTHLILGKLSKPLNQLQSLSGAIGVITQYQGTAACLIWGSLLIVIEVSIRFISILERIVEMLMEITTALPRFDLYIELFSTEDHLKEAVKNLYLDYVTFCIAAISFIKKRPLKKFLTLFWKPLQKEFEDTLRKIKEHSSQAEKWAEAASYAAQERREGEANRRHQEVLRLLPYVVEKKSTTEIRSFSMPRNPKFYGREDVLTKMLDCLQPILSPGSQSALKSYTLHGFGGVGKTQTATEYLHRHLDLYTAVFWFQAETPAILRQEIADAAYKSGAVPGGQTPDVAACIALFQAWLFETKQHWLVIFDNVDKWDDIKYIWPVGDHGSVLLTTRNAELANNTTGRWHLDSYDRLEGVGFLQYLLKDADEDLKQGADTLATEIDGHPLALSHAAGYIVTHHATCTEFLDLFRDLQLKRAVDKSSVSLSSLPEYRFTLEDVWTMSLTKLPEDEQEILNIAAFLNPDSIQQEIIESLAHQSESSGVSNVQELTTDVRARQHRTATLLRSLTLHTLLNRKEKKKFTIHRLLQRDILSRLQENSTKFQQHFQRATQLIRQQFPAQHIAEPLTPFWAQCQDILPHVMRLQTLYTETNFLAQGESFASLLGDAAYYQWERGLLKEALELCAIARGILDKTANDTSVHKADVLNVIGAIYIESGAAHINEGTEIMEKVLQIRRNRLNTRTETDPEFEEDYVCVSNALSNYSCCLIGLREWDRGFQAIDEAINTFKRFTNEDTHAYGWAERYANLGHILAGQGKLEEGIGYAKMATELQRKAFGQSDIRSCLFESYWGNFLLAQGKIQEAHDRHKAALDIRVKNLGPESNDVAKSLYFVARCRYLMKDFDEAELLLNEALGIYRRMYWTENRIARALFLKSMIYEQKGQRQHALELRSEAGILRKQLVGVEPSENDSLELYEQMVFYH